MSIDRECSFCQDACRRECSAGMRSMSLFHWNRDRKAGQTAPETEPAAQASESTGEGAQRNPGIGIGGVSIEEFMDQLNEDMAPDETLERSVALAERIELVTDLDYPGAALAPEDEVRQQLILSKRGAVVFRSARYYHGKGHYGIGRYEEKHIPASSVREIFQLLDTWLFVQKPAVWEPSADRGSWIIRTSFDEGSAEMERGALTDAVVDGIHLSDFIRERIPISDLFLFDGGSSAIL